MVCKMACNLHTVSRLFVAFIKAHGIRMWMWVESSGVSGVGLRGESSGLKGWSGAHNAVWSIRSVPYTLRCSSKSPVMLRWIDLHTRGCSCWLYTNNSVCCHDFCSVSYWFFHSYIIVNKTIAITQPSQYQLNTQYWSIISLSNLNCTHNCQHCH